MKTLNFLFAISLGTVAILVISNITGIQACTPYENCVRTTHSTVVQTTSFNGNQGTYAIPYNMTNGILVASLVDIPAKELIFTFNATGDGKLTVELPRKIIDSTRDGKDKPYLVFVGTWKTDPNRIKAKEIQNDNETRILAIDFTKGENQIGIVGTWFVENNSTYTGWNPFVAFTPLQQYKKGFDAQDVKCKDGFVLVIKSEDETPACVKSQTAQTLIERGWGALISVVEQKNIPILSSSIKIPNTNFTINYNITGNNKVLDANSDVKSESLILSLETTSNGTLTIDIPRTLLDTIKNDRGEGQFYMLADGQETVFEQIRITISDRTFSIPFTNGTQKIEIIATQLI